MKWNLKIYNFFLTILAFSKCNCLIGMDAEKALHYTTKKLPPASFRFRLEEWEEWRHSGCGRRISDTRRRNFRWWGFGREVRGIARVGARIASRKSRDWYRTCFEQTLTRQTVCIRKRICQRDQKNPWSFAVLWSSLKRKESFPPCGTNLISQRKIRHFL